MNERNDFQLVEEHEQKITEQIESKFQNECDYIKKGIPLLNRSANLIYNLPISEEIQRELLHQVLQALLVRNISYLKAAYYLTLKGLYAPTRNNLRTTYENWLTMEYLIKFPKDTRDFIEYSKITFEEENNSRIRYLKKKFTHFNKLKEVFGGNVKELKKYKDFYKHLCDFSHVTLTGISYENQFSEELAKDCFLLILSMIFRTIDAFFKNKIYINKLKGDKEFEKEIIDYMNEIKEKFLI